MNIFCEDSLLYAKDFFSHLGNIEYFSGATVTAKQIRDANVLLVRSTTKVNATLLSQCQHLEFVGTGTAGANHLDLNYLKARNIPCHTAAGCNAIAVAEYVLCALTSLSVQRNKNLLEQRIGIVGVGHIGALLHSRLQAMGVQTVLYDPPLQEKGASYDFSEFGAILECDFITLHVPLTRDGAHPTFHMFNNERLGLLSDDQCLINACRGEVVDNQALLAIKKAGSGLGLVIDVWENEPDILFDLYPFVDIATGHIAGHTIEGKGRGTEKLYQALCQHLNIPVDKALEQFLPTIKNNQLSIVNSGATMPKLLGLLNNVYNIDRDSTQFKGTVKSAEDFQAYRKKYAVRREFSSFTIEGHDSTNLPILNGLGFSNND